MQKQQADNVWNGFAQKYPQLAQQRQLVDYTADQLRASGITFNSQQEAENAIVQQVAGILQQANPGFKLSTPQVPQIKPPSNIPMGGMMTGGAPVGGGTQTNTNPDYDASTFG